MILGILYAFSLSLRYSDSSKSPTTDSAQGQAASTSSSAESDAKVQTSSCIGVRKPYYERNFLGQWLDKALQYWVVGMCTNLQYVHLLQASLTYFIFVGPAATTLYGMASFTMRHFLLGTMPCTMLMAILSTVSKKNDGQLTTFQMVGVVLTLLLPLLDFYRLATFEEGYFADGTIYALCLNYGQHVLYMTTFIGRPHLLQRRLWPRFINWSKFWGILSRQVFYFR